LIRPQINTDDQPESMLAEPTAMVMRPRRAGSRRSSRPPKPEQTEFHRIRLSLEGCVRGGAERPSETAARPVLDDGSRLEGILQGAKYPS
jgi:hypothetical protein